MTSVLSFSLLCLQFSLTRARTFTQCPLPSVEIPDRTTITHKCTPGVTAVSGNNYCLRDDIAAFRRESDPSSLHIIANGCPDHPYFQHGQLQTVFSASGDMSCSMSSTGTVAGDCSSNLTITSNDDATNPFYGYPNVPRFAEYQMTVPASPSLADVVTWPEADQPIGIAINGVLLFSDHSLGFNATRQVDNCGGHSDTSYRYRYHSPPVCLLSAMSATLPATGAYHTQETTSEAQVSHWPALGEPSPVLGISLDGFPIHGPYNASGHLQIAGQSAGLNECSFNTVDGRYYFTPNFPFVPSCFMGAPGSFHAKHLGEGLCPLRGVDSIYCEGEGCIPTSVECYPSITPFMMTRYWILFLILALVLTLWLVWLHVEHILYPEKVQYPYDKAIASMVPAYILILFVQQVYAFFYGTNYSFDDVTLVEPVANKFLGTAIGSYLTVVGVMYGLLVAQIVGIVHEKFVSIRNALSEELASCQQVSVLIKSISVKGNDESQETLKRNVNSLVLHYVCSIHEKWGLQGEDKKTTEILYGAMPMIHELCASVALPLNIQIADRIIDSLNALSTAKHKRLTLEKEQLPFMLWMLQYILSTIMFSGVLLINSGSLELNVFMCFATSILIGMNSLLIADMDMPYIGYITIDHSALTELMHDMTEATRPSRSKWVVTHDSADDDDKGEASHNPLEALARRVIASQRTLLARMRSQLSMSEDDNNAVESDQSRKVRPISVSVKSGSDNIVHVEEQHQLLNDAREHMEMFHDGDEVGNERFV